jgi:hypothetical protein
MKTVWKLIPVLAILMTACAGGVHRDAAPREEAVQSDDTAECSVSLPLHSSSEAIHRALQAVADGSLDPCGGPLAQRELYSANLLRIDQGDRDVVLVFRMLHRDERWGGATLRLE